MKQNKRDSLGNRIKTFYENRTRFYLTRRTPVILRLDGKAFHTLTKSAIKPFDASIEFAMLTAMDAVCKEISGAKIGYVQSDEISILLTDFDKLETEAYFDYNIQKIASVAASIAAVNFTNSYKRNGFFDCRCFNIPKEEVVNYFLWRQKDWIRNSVSMLAQSVFSHKQLHGKSQSNMHEMLHERGINWASLPSYRKNGTFFDVPNNIVSGDIILNRDKTFIEQYLYEEKV